MTSKEMRVHSLEKAQSVRLEKLEVKRQIRMGELKASQVILDPPECLKENTTIYQFLLWQMYWGNRRALKVQDATGINVFKLVGATTERERRAISECLIQTPFPRVN